MKKFFNNIIIKSIIITILPLAYSSIIPVIIDDFSKNNKINIILCIISFVLFLLHMISLWLYGKLEVETKERLQSFNEIDHIKELIRLSNKMVRDNANMFHELVFKKKGHSDIQDWHLLEGKGDEICKSIYQIICNMAEKGTDFAVSMMFKKRENNMDGYTMLSRIATDIDHNPRSYRNFVTENDAADYYYKKIFDESPTEPKILHNKSEIRKHFKDSNAVNYSQYIAIPITCKNNKIVGILQIVAYNDSILAKEKSKLKRLSHTYFALYATLMLLCDKYENVQQIFEV